MEESAYTALYTGTYVMVFIISLTVTIYLFNSIVNFADVAYEFDEKVVDNSVIINQPYGENQLLTSAEVASYYFNYVSYDVSGGENLSKNFDIQIYKSYDTNNSNRITQTYSSYKDLIDVLGKDSKYIMKISKSESNKLYCVIRKATDSEIKAIKAE